MTLKRNQNLEYTEYKLTIGDADFTFFTDTGSIAEESGQITASTHSHQFYELFYISKGSVSINNHLICENSLAAIPKNYEHNSTVNQNSQRIVVSFSIEKNKKCKAKDYYDFFTKKLTCNNIIILENFNDSNAFKRLITYYYGSYTEKAELIRACLCEIIILLKEHLATEKASDISPILSDSDIYRNYIIGNYFYNKFQSGNIIELSKILHISTQQTLRIVKKLYGHSFSEHIFMLKMNYAKKLLTSTDYSGNKISEMIGYKNPHNFYSAFKKHFGITPSAFKEANKNL